MPLDRLVARIDDCPSDVRAAAATLEHNGVWVVGVGCERTLARRPLLALLRRSRHAVLPGHELREVRRRERSGGRHRPLLVVHDRDVVLATPCRGDARALSRRTWSTALVATGPDRRVGADRVAAHDRRRLRLPDPDARPRRGARRRPALAHGARASTRAAGSARGCTRSGTWITPRRWAIDVARLLARGPARGAVDAVSRSSRRQTSMTACSTHSVSGCSSPASASLHCRSPSSCFGRLPGRGLVFARPLGLLAARLPSVVGSPASCTRPVRRARPSWLAWPLLVVSAPPCGCRGLGRIGAASADAPGLGRRRDRVHRRVRGAGRFCAASRRTCGRRRSRWTWRSSTRSNSTEWFPPHDPWQSGSDRQLLLLRPLPRRVPRPSDRDRPGGGLQPRGRARLRARRRRAVFGVAAIALRGGTPTRATRPAVHRSSPGSTAAGLAVAGWVTSRAASSSSMSPGGSATYDWWSPSRVIAGTANEFPFFSFLLGDLHAHVMVTPFALCRRRVRDPAGAPRTARASRARADAARAAELLLAALVLGALYATNSFDFPTAVAIGLGALLVWALEAPGRCAARRSGALGWVAARGASSTCPFWRHFSPPDERDRPRPRAHARSRASPATTAASTASSLWIVARALRGSTAAAPPLPGLGRSAALLFVLVLLAPIATERRSRSCSSCSRRCRLRDPRNRRARASRTASSVAPRRRCARPARGRRGRVPARRVRRHGELPLQHGLQDRVPGVVPPRDRRRRQRALEQALARGAAPDRLARRARRPRRPRARLSRGSGSYSRTNRFSNGPTLDGMAWLRTSAPGDAAAIEWLRAIGRRHAHAARDGGTATSIPTDADACRRSPASRP